MIYVDHMFSRDTIKPWPMHAEKYKYIDESRGMVS